MIMKITAQKGRGNKVHILVDGEYKMTVTSDFWLSQNIRCDDEIDDEEFAAFCKAASSARAFNAAVNILSHRDHSAKELMRKVSRNCDNEAAREAVERLEEMGYINDERYAQSLAQELFERKGMGLRRIEQELCRRGVSRETARECVENIECDDVARILDLLQTKYAGRFDDEKGRKRTFAALTRLGYSYSDIMSAMRQAGECDFEDDYS